jgi:3-deoxy-D-manno-octulosonic-acid transferase
MFQLYNLFSLVALIAYLPFLILKKGPEKRLTYLGERLGKSNYTKADIWIHAVSVGEVIAALPFLKALKHELPDVTVILSTTTYTGQKIAREKCPGPERIMYMPWDTSVCISRTVKNIKPKIFVTVETEIWPVLFHTFKKYGSHIIILNGRISPASFKGYKKIKTFMKKVLSLVDFLYMQSQLDADRIIAIGAHEKKVGIMGNFKFDIEINQKKPPKWLDVLRGPVFLAGSTHKGEEEIILDAYETVKAGCADLKLLIAPRHPERFNEVEEILKRRNFNFCKRSMLNQEPGDRGIESYDVILLDTIGELSQLFSRADVALIGGSLLPYGGHNILEPSYWGKPIMFGPHMDNFPIAKEFLNEGAAIMVNNPGDIAHTVIDLLRDTEKAIQMGQKAKSIMNRNTGAVNKALVLVRSLLGDT